MCEPIVRARLELPAESTGAVLTALGRLGAATQTSSTQGRLATIETVLPSARAQDLQRQLPGLTGGEGVLEARFAGYEPASGDQAARRRTAGSNCA